ncbi:MAG: amidohydrolase family protein [Pseudomonadales bacterium]|nr:amidohydrolase family protein [Pseudomonadales bacterium]MBO6597789.1 amidohydrolase family protein [Pseudomonadales bacterium]MBO6824027.1 amidohydrolase family protein [Pseudomonadales bacterium]
MSKARIDAHQNFWAFNEADYPGLQDNNILQQDYLPAYIEPALIENGFHGSIAVQCRDSLDETEFLISLSEEKSIIGVVGWVDLTAGNLLATLSRYQGKVNGFRYPLIGQPEAFLKSEALNRGLRLLQDFGFTFDLLVSPDQLTDCAALVDELPDQPFVLNHLGCPEYSEAGFNTWAEPIKVLAERPNVYCKLSSLVVEGGHGEWDEDVLDIDPLLPFVEVAIESFTPERLMFASDWPYCTMKATYDEVCDITATCIDNLSISEQAAIMGNTAARFYNITGLS